MRNGTRRARELRHDGAPRAVDAVDALGDGLNDRDDGSPPPLRTDLLKLYQLAMDVFTSSIVGYTASCLSCSTWPSNWKIRVGAGGEMTFRQA